MNSVQKTLSFINTLPAWLSSRQAAIIALLGVTLMAAAGLLRNMDVSVAVFSGWWLWLLATFCLLSLLAYLWRDRTHFRGVAGIGTLLLHAGLVLAIVGGTWNAMDSQRFSARVLVGDHVSLPGTQTQLSLKKLFRQYEVDGWAKGDAVSLSAAIDGKTVADQVVYVNQPLRVSGWEVSHGQRGYAAELEMSNAQGRPLFQGLLMLNTSLKPEIRLSLVQALDYLPLSISLDLTQTMESGKEKLGIELIHQREGSLGKADLRPGKTAIIHGYRLRFIKVRPWVAIQAKRELGIWLVATAMWIMVLGATMALLSRWKKI